jgi:hypothetical protein
MSKSSAESTGKDPKSGKGKRSQSHGKRNSSSKSLDILFPGFWNQWSKKFIRTSAETFGRIARLCETLEYYIPPTVDKTPFDMEDKTEKMLYVEECKTRLKTIHRLDEQKDSFFATIMSKLSDESEEMVMLDNDFEAANRAKCPLTLWKIIKKTHASSSNSRVPEFNKLEIRQTYTKISMGYFETLIVFKQRFDAARLAYDAAHTDQVLKETDVVMDYLDALCPQRYSLFKTSYMNDLVMETVSPIKTLNEMHLKASMFVVNTTQKGSHTTGSVYAATIDREWIRGGR